MSIHATYPLQTGSAVSCDRFPMGNGKWEITNIEGFGNG